MYSKKIKFKIYSIQKKLFKLSNQKKNKNEFNNNIYIYIPIYWKINSDFFSIIPYILYYENSIIVNKKLNSNKFFKILFFVRIINKVMKNKWKSFFKSNKFFNKSRLNLVISYLYLYNFFLNNIFIDVYYLSKFFKIRNYKNFFYLFLKFNKNKLIITLQNNFKKNLFFLSAGLFIKFFEKKKSFKKNKTIKILMAKFIRKLLIISKIKNLIIVIKNLPTFLIEIINFLNSPIIHKFTDPTNNVTIEEKNDNKNIFRILFFIFLNNKSFSFMKTKKKGRIKRKILRKLVIENKLID